MSLNQAREPEYGDGWWQLGYGSGRIVHINYAMRTVLVTFYEKGHRLYSFESIIGCFMGIHGGTWTIPDEDIGESS